MSGDLLALMDGIRANPEDVLARLVVADWIEEHGAGCGIPHPAKRAHYIRLACKFHDADGDPSANKLVRKQLERQYGGVWCPTANAPETNPETNPSRWVLGFAQSCTFRLEDWLLRGHYTAAMHTLTELHLTGAIYHRWEAGRFPAVTSYLSEYVPTIARREAISRIGWELSPLCPPEWAARLASRQRGRNWSWYQCRRVAESPGVYRDWFPPRFNLERVDSINRAVGKCAISWALDKARQITHGRSDDQS